MSFSLTRVTFKRCD